MFIVCKQNNRPSGISPLASLSVGLTAGTYQNSEYRKIMRFLVYLYYRKNLNIIRTIFTNNRGSIAGVCIIHVNLKNIIFQEKSYIAQISISGHMYIVHDYSHQTVITLQN